MSNNQPTLQDEIKAPSTNPGVRGEAATSPARRRLLSSRFREIPSTGSGKPNLARRRHSFGILRTSILMAIFRSWRAPALENAQLCGGLRLGIHPS